jgi:mRNA interferase RelE/StbE
MAYRVVFRRSAARELASLPQPIRGRVTRAVDALATNPRPPGAKLLREPGGRWRLRVGDYRVLYRVDDDRVVVVVVRVRHRSIAYRGL